MHRLENKVAVITGAASGIGSACALRFAQEGAIIAGFDISRETDDTWKTAAEVASQSAYHTGDIRDEDHISSTIESLAQRCFQPVHR